MKTSRDEERGTAGFEPATRGRAIFFRDGSAFRSIRVACEMHDRDVVFVVVYACIVRVVASAAAWRLPFVGNARVLAARVFLAASGTLLTPFHAVYTEPPAFKVEPRLGPLKGPGAREADDPAVWVHPHDPARSLIFTCDKRMGIDVFDLEGAHLQHVGLGTRINNIDVRPGFRFGAERVDIVAANLRSAGKLAVLGINPEYSRGDVLSVLSDQRSRGNDISSDSYGFALYRRPSDGALFVFDKSKDSSPIRQWRIDEHDGRIQTHEVRRITDIKMGVAEGFVADDTLGFVYFAEERRGIHKYNADPDRGSRTRLAFFAQDDGIVGDREGLSLHTCPAGGGYLVLSSQGNSTLKLYARRGDNRLLSTFRARKARGTDGLDILSTRVPGFPSGFLVVHDEPGTRYYVYDWRDVMAGAALECDH